MGVRVHERERQAVELSVRVHAQVARRVVREAVCAVALHPLARARGGDNDGEPLQDGCKTRKVNAAGGDHAVDGVAYEHRHVQLQHDGRGGRHERDHQKRQVRPHVAHDAAQHRAHAVAGDVHPLVGTFPRARVAADRGYGCGGRSAGCIRICHYADTSSGESCDRQISRYSAHVRSSSACVSMPATRPWSSTSTFVAPMTALTR